MSNIIKNIRRVYMLGLDNVGKTSIITYLALGKFEQKPRTLGMETTKITIESKLVYFIDVGGQLGFRKSWLQGETWGYTRKARKPAGTLVVFVVDPIHFVEDDRWEEAKLWLGEVKNGFSDPDLIIFSHVDQLEMPYTPDTYLEHLGCDPATTSFEFVSATIGTNVKESFAKLINRS